MKGSVLIRTGKMRLLNVHSLELEEFFDQHIPPYAILSHRWSFDEVTYKDMKKHRIKDGLGYKKITDCAAFVKGRGRYESFAHQDRAIDWVWIDTCCIDKRSSAELTEAINSMWQWYKQAVYCVAYLGDVPSLKYGYDNAVNEFKSSAWFTRGWCLQELLAPLRVIFCNREWVIIGEKNASQGGGSTHPLLTAEISEAASIPERFLRNPISINSASVAMKMSWASRRHTTRVEDMAYSLMGLFDVNMPLLYGEGSKAFVRLQHEIIKQSDDEYRRPLK